MFLYKQCFIDLLLLTFLYFRQYSIYIRKLFQYTTEHVKYKKRLTKRVLLYIFKSGHLVYHKERNTKTS